MRGSKLMIFALTSSLAEELTEIDSVCRESLQIWWDDLASLRENLQNDKSFQFMPAVVVLAYKYLDSDHRLTVNMAGLFKTLYFANLIHNQVMDEEEGQLNDQKLQFTILIGDYIFGRVLKLLLKIGAVQVLDNLAFMICRINEGLVMEYKLGAEQLEVIKKGNAAIYEAAFLTAARLKMLDQDAIQLYGRLGLNIGMAVELMIAENTDQALTYIGTSFELLNQFKNAYGFKGNYLQDLLQEMSNQIRDLNWPAAGCQ
jgi:geranylgeranyl pyrophosphate synthase